MAIARYSDGGGGGTGKKATYSTQKRTYATYGKSNSFQSKVGNWNNLTGKPMVPNIQPKPNTPKTENKPNQVSRWYQNATGQPLPTSQNPVVDRWATAPTAQTYQNNYAALLKKQQQQAAYDKWITRNRELRNDLSGAPIVRADGYRYILPGGGYVPEAMNAGYNNTPSNYGNSYAGGGWGDYGGYYGGGGGGGYSTPAPEWWLSMTTWKV